MDAFGRTIRAPSATIYDCSGAKELSLGDPGINVAAASRPARRLGLAHTIVRLLWHSGDRTAPALQPRLAGPKGPATPASALMTRN